jgi:hypothetical protein
MNAADIRDLLHRLRRGIGQPSVILECCCENLETVYVSLSEADDVLVSDHGKTFEYLSSGTDSTYRPIDDLFMVAAAEACRQLGTNLTSDDRHTFPRIDCPVDSLGSVSAAVEKVADAVDRVFYLALRVDLK